jgi:hypothetical protein
VRACTRARALLRPLRLPSNTHIHAHSPLRRYARNFTQCGSKVIAAPTAASVLTLTGLRAGTVTAAVFYNTTTGAPLPVAAGGSATLASGALVIVFPDFWEDAAAYITMA